MVDYSTAVQPVSQAAQQSYTQCQDGGSTSCGNVVNESGTMKAITTTTSSSSTPPVQNPSVNTGAPSTYLSGVAGYSSVPTTWTSTNALSTTSGAQQPVSTTAVTMPVNSSTPAPKSSSLSSRVVVGVALGCVVVGALLGALIMLWISKRRLSRHGGANSYTGVMRFARELDPAEKHTAGMSVDHRELAILDLLPAQEDDNAVRQRVSSLIDHIQLHVENFYHDDPVEVSTALQTDLSHFETSQLRSPLPSCFMTSTKPTHLIQHCLAFHILNLTLALGEATISPLLPKETASIIAANQSKALSPDVSRADLEIYSQWKCLTAYLLPQKTSANDYLPPEQLETATRIGNHFSNVFTPWSNQKYPDANRSRHLIKLVVQAANTATWLFGQVDCYKFDWTSPEQTRNRTIHNDIDDEAVSLDVVVAPSMTKMTHAGQPLKRPQKMLNAVVKRAQ